MSITEYNQLPELLSQKDVVSITGWAPKTVVKMRESGVLRAWKEPGSRFRYYKTELFRKLGITLTR